MLFSPFHGKGKHTENEAWRDKLVPILSSFLRKNVLIAVACACYLCTILVLWHAVYETGYLLLQIES